MVDITDLSYLKGEQDSTDSVQDLDRDLKANIADVRTAVDQDIIDNAQNAVIAEKALIDKNMRSYFDVATSTLYTTDDGSDPHP